MAIDKDLLDRLLEGRDPRELFSAGGLVDELKKSLSERILAAELDDHLETEDASGRANRRNGTSKKTVLTGTSQVTLDIPRDRAGTFDPKLIARYQRRFPDFDEKIVSMYARGMSVREIRGHLEDLYGIDVSPDLISAVTDAVLQTVSEWQGRPLDACYPLVFFDAIRVKIRDEGFVRNKAVYIALGILPDGTKDILGLWIEQTEGAKFWLRVMNELKSRGVADILIAVVDGLKGFPEAITAAFPQAIVQTCIVHLLRNSMNLFVGLTRPSATVPPHPGRTARRWRPPCAGSTVLPTPKRVLPPSRRSRQGHGGRNIPPSANAGDAYGKTSFPSLPFRKPCGGSSTQRTPLKP
jgi:putative transposase